jgi:uncharacterized protein YbjT (DUF2867 family)
MEDVMTIAITTPTGRIGRRIAEILASAGESVVLLARDPDKLAELASSQAVVRKGALDDRQFVLDATRGVKALFLLIPPNFAVPDYRAWQREVGDIAARAITENRIERVVLLSSVGAQLSEGTGPIAGLYDVERRLADSAKNLLALRAGLFHDNYLMQLDAIRAAGKVFMPVPGEVRLPMVATRDIGEVAAHMLRDTSWEGHAVRGVHGPADLSFHEAAAAIGAGIGNDVEHVQVTSEQAREAMAGMGLPAHVTELYLEMYAAMASGALVTAEPRSPETTTATTLEDFAREVIRPLL